MGIFALLRRATTICLACFVTILGGNIGAASND